MCGKTFEGKQEKYCSFQCSWKAKQEKSQRKTKFQRKETLCWTCQNACGGCSWSKSFTPVEGWDAKPTKHKHVDSFLSKNVLNIFKMNTERKMGDVCIYTNFNWYVIDSNICNIRFFDNLLYRLVNRLVI